MSLLTAPFPQNNPATLAELVLAGLEQHRKEMDAETRISQDEMDNWQANAKLASQNMLGLQSAALGQRDQLMREQQTGFNQYLGLEKLDMERKSEEALAAERKAHAAYWANGGTHGGTALSDIPFGQPMTDETGMPMAPGGAPALPAGGLPMPPSDMAAPPGSVPGPASNPLFPSEAPPDSARPSADAMAGIKAGAAGKIDQMTAAGKQMADEHAKQYGQGWQASIAPDSDASPEEKQSAQGIANFNQSLTDLKGELDGTKTATTGEKAPTPGVAAGAINPGDPNTLPYNKRISLGGYRGVEKMRINGADYLQYYARDPKSGLQKAMGEPRTIKDLMGEEARAPMAVQLPENKVAAYDTAKFWLEKIYPGMDVKDRAANAQQAMQIHDTLTKLSNDPDVQSHLKSTGQKEFTIPPGQQIENWKLDLKTGDYYPTFKVAKQEDVEAAKTKTAQIRTMWDQYKNWKTASEDVNIGADRRAAAKAKAQGLFNAIQQLDSGAPTSAPKAGSPAGAGTGATPTSPDWYYGQ